MRRQELHCCDIRSLAGAWPDRGLPASGPTCGRTARFDRLVRSGMCTVPPPGASPGSSRTTFGALLRRRNLVASLAVQAVSAWAPHTVEPRSSTSERSAIARAWPLSPSVAFGLFKAAQSVDVTFTEVGIVSRMDGDTTAKTSTSPSIDSETFSNRTFGEVEQPIAAAKEMYEQVPIREEIEHMLPLHLGTLYGLLADTARVIAWFKTAPVLDFDHGVGHRARFGKRA